MKDHCAWCLAPIADEAPIETVSASVPEIVDAASGSAGVRVAGRALHALVPPEGFPLTEDPGPHVGEAFEDPCDVGEILLSLARPTLHVLDGPDLSKEDVVDRGHRKAKAQHLAE